MVRRRTQPIPSAVERRIRALAPSASSFPHAVRQVATKLLLGVECPPTNLVELGKKIDVHEIVFESFPGSGELHRGKHGYRIVCSSDQPLARQRFTVAHEFGHVIIERTGRNPPRKGPKVERVCDMLATELLMPTSVFRRLLPERLSISAIVDLAKSFRTSMKSTAIRCAELLPVCVFFVAGSRVEWGYGGIRAGAVEYLIDQVRDNVLAVMAGGTPSDHVYFYGNVCRTVRYCRFHWTRSRRGGAWFLLVPEDLSTARPSPDRRGQRFPLDVSTAQNSR